MSTSLRVIALQKEPAEIIRIYFEPISGTPVTYRAGQFLTLAFRLGGVKTLRRSYSFCSSPDVDEPLAIAVKLVENGEISRLLHHQLRVGDMVEMAAAGGQFIYPTDPLIYRTLFLFAAGVGITPLLSILKTALVKEVHSKLVLVFSSRSAEDTPFAKDIAHWKARYPERLQVIHLYSSSPNLLRARLNGPLINTIVTQELTYARDAALFYLCGPVDYMDVCRISLLSAGFKAEQIRRETFVLPEDEADEDDTTEKVVDKKTYRVALQINGKTHRFDVPYPKRILDVALEHKIDVPYSCSGGVCSTCTATCVKGHVRMDYNEVLTDEELAAGRVLICTGHPTENDTTIVYE